MDRQERFDFSHGVEDYLETKGVYELFESLLKDLVAKRPKEPLDFLIDKLSKPQGKIRLC
jgi:adenylate kinase